MTQLNAYTRKRVVFDVSGSGDNQIVALVPAKAIVVVNYSLITHGDVEAKFVTDAVESGRASEISGVLTGTEIHGQNERDEEYGLFSSEPGEALVLNLSAAVRATGHLTYVESDAPLPRSVV